MKKFWNFTQNGGKGELILYGEISDVSWYGDEVTPKQFKEDLDALGNISELDIYINSGGGDVFAGYAIYNMIARVNATKMVYIDGIAASVASVIAMAGDKIIMPKNAMMMIHNAWTFAAGNKAYLRKLADNLERVDDGILDLYETRTGTDRAKIKAMMDSETWMNAEEAVALGFADEIETSTSIAASMDKNFFVVKGSGGDIRIDAARYANIPKIEAVQKPKEEQQEAKHKPPEQGGIFTPENGGDSQPVTDTVPKEQYELFNKIKEKLLGV